MHSGEEGGRILGNRVPNTQTGTATETCSSLTTVPVDCGAVAEELLLVVVLVVEDPKGV